MPVGHWRHGGGGAGGIVSHFGAAASVAAEDVALAVRSQQRQVVAGDHAAIADEDHPGEPEALLEIGQHRGHGRGVAVIAGEDVMGGRPAVNHDQADQDLALARLAVAAVAVRAQARRPVPFEIGRGEVVEHQIDLEGEQVAQA